jgi:hypothetical protein
MTNFRNFASAARRHVAALGSTIGIPQLRTLVVLKRWREGDVHRKELFEVPCYADFVTPKEGTALLGQQVLANQDYLVKGLDTTIHPAPDFYDTGASFWLDAHIVAGEVSGGFACDLLTYREHMITLDLYLRKKPNER